MPLNSVMSEGEKRFRSKAWSGGFENGEEESDEDSEIRFVLLADSASAGIMVFFGEK